MTDRTEPTDERRSVADVATPHASRYLQQLCKHFAHRLPVTFDPAAGHIAFDGGDCRLAATDGLLSLTVTASGAEQRARLEDVVARHLVRFAFREDMTIDWRAA